jgi:CRP/FNR family transcriptional activator FtrB
MVVRQSIVDSNLMKTFVFFDDINEAGLAKLAELATVLEVPADTELLREGEPADYVYILLEGRVSLCLPIPGKVCADTAVSTLSKGQLLGWSALLPCSRWQASVYTLKTCRFVRVSAAELRSLCEHDYELGYHIMKNALTAVGQRLSECRMQQLDIFGELGG